MANGKRKLKQEDWDFSACPTHQLPFCLVYEYARESQDSIKRVAKWRENGNWPEMLPFENSNWMQGLPKVSFLERFPEFPETPWLLIDVWERNRRIDSCPEYDPPVQRVGVDSLIENNDYQDLVTSDEPRGWYTTLPMRINWLFDENRLAQEFKHWIHINRDHIGHPPDIRHAPTSHKEYLKKLSALRLLKFYTVQQAVDKTKECLKDPIDNRAVPLYGNYPNVWKRAKDEAERLIVRDDLHHCKSPVGREILGRITEWGLPIESYKAMREYLFRSPPDVLRELKKLSSDQLRGELMTKLGR